MHRHILAKLLLIILIGAASIWVAVRYGIFAFAVPVSWLGTAEEFIAVLGRMIIVRRATAPFVRFVGLCLIVLFGAAAVARAQKRIVALFAGGVSWMGGLWQRTPRMYRVMLFVLSVPVVGFLGWGIYLLVFFLPVVLFRKVNALAIDRAFERWFGSKYRRALRESKALQKIRAPYRALEYIILRWLRRSRKRPL